jgi:polysaccharide export outer membrane protein
MNAIRKMVRLVLSSGFSLALFLSAAFLTGCQTSENTYKPLAAGNPGPAQPESIRLREGDMIRIQFPGAPNLDTKETIHRDGKITLMVGEVTAAGKTLQELQKEILDLYSPQLVTKVVTVSLEASVFPVYVTGAVARGGKIVIDRPVTALEAVMDAGVDLARANLKAVRVTRTAQGQNQVFTLNLDKILKGKGTDTAPFYLQPSDILYVPEKFQWY